MGQKQRFYPLNEQDEPGARVVTDDMTTDQLKPGDKVHYCPEYGKIENGIVKAIPTNGAFVVYHCNGDWDNYQDYTAQLTDIEDLREGWYEDDSV
jgi:hypothetical protein